MSTEDLAKCLIRKIGRKGREIKTKHGLEKGAYVRVIGFSVEWVGRIVLEDECDGEGDYWVEPVEPRPGRYDWFHARYLEPLSLLEMLAHVAQDPK